MQKPVTEFYQELNHTADIGIRLQAETRTALFERAALAMFDIILSSFEPCAETETVDIDVNAASSDLLLREWLAELLYMHMTKMLFVTSADITGLSDTQLVAKVRTIPMTDRMIADATEIKAVTYHGLSLLEAETGYEAQIIFDT
jgi:SHS2 domain-containing protein